jgi:hypothetical protein
MIASSLLATGLMLVPAAAALLTSSLVSWMSVASRVGLTMAPGVSAVGFISC